ncbi:TPA: DUF2079 domain-containing protein, partial [Streptococcus pyogenes]|nr:DUF2079 domain-containing protein [Streptococcus pyogenes]
EQKLNKTQSIYVWDDTSKIYLDSKAKSVSQFSSPDINTQKESHRKILEDELLENKAAYIVVNRYKNLPKIIQKVLSTNYKVDKQITTKSFIVYQKK